jgi:hypothetical protein
MQQFYNTKYIYINNDSSVRIVKGYELDGQSSIPGSGKSFSLLHSVQTSSGIHPASYPIGTGDSFSEVKVGGAQSSPFTSTSHRGQECWSYMSIPAKSSWGGVN